MGDGFSGQTAERAVANGAEGALDLFGRPVEPLRDRRGRPSFAKTPENQDFVAVRAAAGWKQSAIASALGCDEKTLRKHFSRELNDGLLIIEGMALDVWLKRLREGHGPSIRALLDRIDQAHADRRPRPAPKPEADDDDAPEAAGPIGKKALRDLAAQDVPDDWAETISKRGRQ